MKHVKDQLIKKLQEFAESLANLLGARNSEHALKPVRVPVTQPGSKPKHASQKS